MGDDSPSVPTEPHPQGDARQALTGPPEPLTQAAMRLIPPTLADMENTSENPGPDPQAGLKIVRYSQLVTALRDRGQSKDVAATAIRRLVAQGMLTVRQPGPSAPVFCAGGRGRSATTVWPLANESAAIEDCLIESTPKLHEWWTRFVEETEPSTQPPQEQPAKPNAMRRLCSLVLQIRERELARDLKRPHERPPQTTEYRAELKHELRELVADCWAAGRNLGEGREREAEEAAKHLADACGNLLLWEHAVRLGLLSEEEAKPNKGGPCVVLVNRLYPAYDRLDHLARLCDRVDTANVSGEKIRPISNGQDTLKRLPESAHPDGEELPHGMTAEEEPSGNLGREFGQVAPKSPPIASMADTTAKQGNERRGDGQGKIAKSNTPGEGEKTSHMTVQEANTEAMALAKRLKRDFFLLSRRKQAKRIGCSFATWTKTALYPLAEKERIRFASQLAKPPAPPSPAAMSLTKGLEAVKGEGKPGEILNQLIAAENEVACKRKWEDLSPAEQQQLLSEQEADHESSPLEDDSPGRRPQVIRSRKRV